MANEPSGAKLSAAVLRVFDQQLAQHDRSGKQDFATGNWHGKLARALLPELNRLYLASAKRTMTGEEDEERLAATIAAAAKADSIVLAEQLNQTTTTWLEEGRDPEQVFGADRAAMIGVTQASDAFNATKVAVGREVGHKRKRWRCTDDSCCKDCRSLNGKSVKIEQMFRSKSGVSVPGPPLHPHCLLGETPVVSTGTVVAFKSPYRGPVVRIVVSSGEEFTCTVHHNFMTPVGLRAAALLERGDDLIYCPLSQWIGRRYHPNYDQVPIAIKDVVGTFAESVSGSTTRVPVSPEDIHGDGEFIDSYIDVIGADRLLRRAGVASSDHAVDDVLLQAVNSGSRLDGLSDLATVLKCLRLASDSGMRGLGIIESLLRGHAGVLDGCRLLGRTNRKSQVLQGLNNPAPRYSQISSDSENRVSGVVTTTQVVKVEQRFFRGHVFDLHTVTGSYIIANGIASCNCNCELETF